MSTLSSQPRRVLSACSFAGHWEIVPVGFALAYVLLRFSISDLSAWDMPAHLQQAITYQQHVWPSMHGWNAQELGGTPQGYGYPPLLHWLVGGMGRFIEIRTAFRFTIVLSIVALPFAIHSFLRAIQFDAVAARTGTLALIGLLAAMGGPIHYGGTFFGTFFGGLASNAFAMPLYFAYLGVIAQGAHSRTKLLIAAALLASIIMSHAYVAVMSGVSSLTLFALAYRPFRTRSLLRYLGHVVLGLLLSAVWWLPYVKYRAYFSGRFDSGYSLVAVIWNSTPGALFAVAAVLSVLVVAWRRRNISRVLSTLLVAHTGAYAAAALVGTLPGLERTPIHTYRFFPYVAVFACLTILQALLVLGWQGLERLASVVTCALLVSGANDWFPLHERNMQLASMPDPNARGLLVHDRFGAQTAKAHAPHLLTYDLTGRGFKLLNGLFIESAAVSNYVHALLYRLNPQAFLWFAERLPSQRRLDSPAQEREQLASQCGILGIRWVLSDAPLESLSSTVRERIVDGQIVTETGSIPQPFYYYQLGFELVDFVQPRFVTDRGSWSDRVNAWWGNPSLDDVPVQVPSLEDQAAGRITSPDDVVTLHVASPERFDVVIRSRAARWVLIKIPYFPDWEATQGGQPMPVSRAAPDFMAIHATGSVQFRFRPSPLVRTASIASAVTWLGWLVAAGSIVVRKLCERRDLPNCRERRRFTPSADQ